MSALLDRGNCTADPVLRTTAVGSKGREVRTAPAIDGLTSCCTDGNVVSYGGRKEGAMIADRLKRITVEAGKCGGRPCIRGQRIRVTDILELLAAGAGLEEILADYPFLESEDVYAAIEYAAHQADHAVLQAS
jgi:uncharacterized protein (DUF433 family)